MTWKKNFLTPKFEMGDLVQSTKTNAGRTKGSVVRIVYGGEYYETHKNV